MRKTSVISAGLLAAWVLHDTEEYFTAVAGSREVARRIPRWVPIPADIRENGFSQKHFNTGLAVMAAFIGSAAASGVRSGGRSWFFQTTLQGFGWHGFGHIAASVLSRRYTSGVATSPVVVIPYWLWARRALAREGVPLRNVTLPAILLVPPVIVGAHVIARLLTAPSRRHPAQQLP